MPTHLTKEELIQEQILQAARQLFGLYGLAKVTMEDVARAIGKTRGSIYYYYKSKEEILDAVIGMEIGEVRAAMEKAVDEGTNSETKIAAFFAAKLRMAKEKYSFFDALESGMDADALSVFKKVKVTHHDTTLQWEGALLSRVLKEGIARGELKPLRKTELDDFLFILLSSLHGLKREMRLEGNHRPIEPIAANMSRIVLKGLAL